MKSSRTKKDNGSHMELEWVPCIVCDGIETTPLFSARRKNQEFHIVQCRDCGLVYVNPRPSLEAMSEFYPDPVKGQSSTPAFRPDPGITPRVGFRSKYLEFYDRLAQGSRSISVLDYVCRNGSFLQILRGKYGWRQLCGIEIRPTLAKIATESGFEVHLGSLEEAHFPGRFFPGRLFDVIVLRHYFEHLHNPLVALKEIHRTLKDDGFLRIEVPNIDSLGKAISGRRWAGFYIPWHLYYFSPETLTYLLNKAGFKVIESRTLPYPHFLLSSVFALLNRLVPRRQRKAVTKVFKPGNSVLIGAVLAPFNYFSTLINKGDEIIVICQKASKPEIP